MISYFLTDTCPLIITVNNDPGHHVVPTVLAVGAVQVNAMRIY